MSVVRLIAEQPGQTLELELQGVAWLSIPQIADRVEVAGVDFRIDGRRHRANGDVELIVSTSHVLPEKLDVLGFTSSPHS